MVSKTEQSELVGPLTAVADELGLSTEATNSVLEILQAVSKEDVSTHSHGTDNVCAAVLLMACRQHDEPVTMTEVVEAWSPVEPSPETGKTYSHSSVGRAFNHLSRVLEISTRPTRPESLIERAASDLGLSEKTRAIAENIVGAVRFVDAPAVGSIQPNGVAATALYLAALVDDEADGTQKYFGDAVEVDPVTIRENQRTFMQRLREHPELAGIPEPSPNKYRQFEPLEAEQFLSIEQLQSPPDSLETASDEKERVPHAAVLFGDIRNFTSIVQLYNGAYSTINELFGRIEQTIETEHEGTVEKLLGDGIMAVWTGEDAPERALACATAILESDLPDLQAEAPFELEMGFGIATGDLWRVEIGDVERTVFGDNVNFAARLEGLCKRFDAELVVDAQTADAVDESVPLYRVPDREIRGVNERRDIFIRPTGEAVEPSDVNRFNQATTDLSNGFYAEALEFFASMYGDNGHPYNQALIQRLAVECFDEFERGRGQAHAGRDLYLFTGTQRERARPLVQTVANRLSEVTDDDPRVLEVWCGDGEVLADLAAEWESATFVGIDTSPEAVEEATLATPANVRVQRASPDRLEVDEPFDVVYLNSPLYSSVSYLDTMQDVRGLVAADGHLVIQQAPPELDQTLRENAAEAAVNMGYERIFEQFEYPIDFPTGDQLHAALDSRQWEPTIERVTVDRDPSERIQDFVEVGLTPYTECFSNAVEQQKFESEFQTVAQAFTTEFNETVLLVTATPA